MPLLHSLPNAFMSEDANIRRCHMGSGFFPVDTLLIIPFPYPIVLVWFSESEASISLVGPNMQENIQSITGYVAWRPLPQPLPWHSASSQVSATHLKIGTRIWKLLEIAETSLIARFMGSTRGPSGADRTQVGPMLAPWTLLSGLLNIGHRDNSFRSYLFICFTSTTRHYCLGGDCVM